MRRTYVTVGLLFRNHGPAKRTSFAIPFKQVAGSETKSGCRSYRGPFKRQGLHSKNEAAQTTAKKGTILRPASGVPCGAVSCLQSISRILYCLLIVQAKEVEDHMKENKEAAETNVIFFFYFFYSFLVCVCVCFCDLCCYCLAIIVLGFAFQCALHTALFFSIS